MKRILIIILTVILSISMLTGCFSGPRIPQEESSGGDSDAAGLPLGKYSLVSLLVEGEEIINDLPGHGISPGDVYFALKESNEFSANFTVLFDDDMPYAGRGKFEVEGNNLNLYYFDDTWDELVIDGTRVVHTINDDFIMTFEKTYAEGHSPAELKEFERRLADLPARDPGPSAEEFIELVRIAAGLLLLPESVLLTDDSWAEFSDPLGDNAPRFRDAIYRKELTVFGKPMYVQISISNWAVFDIRFQDKSSPSGEEMLALMPGVSGVFGQEPDFIYLNGDKVSFADVKSAVESKGSGGDFNVSLYWTGVRLDGEPINVMTSYYYSKSSETVAYNISSDKSMADIESGFDDIRDALDD